MQPNKHDRSFAECGGARERTDEMIARLLKQRLVLYIAAGIQFGLLVFDMIGHLVFENPRRGEAPMMLGVTAVLFVALALHADAKAKTLLILKEIRKEK